MLCWETYGCSAERQRGAVGAGPAAATAAAATAAAAAAAGVGAHLGILAIVQPAGILVHLQRIIVLLPAKENVPQVDVCTWQTHKALCLAGCPDNLSAGGRRYWCVGGLQAACVCMIEQAEGV